MDDFSISPSPSLSSDLNFRYSNSSGMHANEDETVPATFGIIYLVSPVSVK